MYCLPLTPTIILTLSVWVAQVSASFSSKLFCFQCHRNPQDPGEDSSDLPNTGLVAYTSIISIDVESDVSDAPMSCNATCLEAVSIAAANTQDLSPGDIVFVNQTSLGENSIEFVIGQAVPISYQYYYAYGSDDAALEMYLNTTGKFTLSSFEDQLHSISESMSVVLFADASVTSINFSDFAHVLREPTMSPVPPSAANYLAVGMSILGAALFFGCTVGGGLLYYFHRKKRIAEMDMSELPYTYPMDVMPGAVLSIHGEARVERCDSVATASVQGSYDSGDGSSPRRRRSLTMDTDVSLSSQTQQWMAQLSSDEYVRVDNDETPKMERKAESKAGEINDVDLPLSVGLQGEQFSGAVEAKSVYGDNDDDKNEVKDTGGGVDSGQKHPLDTLACVKEDDFVDDAPEPPHDFDPNDTNRPFITLRKSSSPSNVGLMHDDCKDDYKVSESTTPTESEEFNAPQVSDTVGKDDYKDLELASPEALSEVHWQSQGIHVKENSMFDDGDNDGSSSRDPLEGLPMSFALERLAAPPSPPPSRFIRSTLFAENGLKLFLERWSNRRNPARRNPRDQEGSVHAV